MTCSPLGRASTLTRQPASERSCVTQPLMHVADNWGKAANKGKETDVFVFRFLGSLWFHPTLKKLVSVGVSGSMHRATLAKRFPVWQETEWWSALKVVIWDWTKVNSRVLQWIYCVLCKMNLQLTANGMNSGNWHWTIGSENFKEGKPSSPSPSCHHDTRLIEGCGQVQARRC